MKKLMALLLAAAITLSLTACGGGQETTDSEEKIKIGILQQLEHP